jgi:hypothetical protein
MTFYASPSISIKSGMMEVDLHGAVYDAWNLHFLSVPSQIMGTP